MTIHQMIASNRKKLRMTQEQVAKALGVSTPAVNKWENGITCPDFELLCPLARLLKLDMNTLFCFREDLTETEILELMQKISETVQQSGFEEGMKEAEAKIQEYPANEQLLYKLALLMDGLLVMSVGTTGIKRTEDIEVHKKTLLAWYQRCICSEDEKIRNGTLYMLASKYTNNQQFEEAEKYAEQLPDSTGLDKNLLKINILLGKEESEEAAKRASDMVQKAAGELQTYMLKWLDAEMMTGNIELARQIAATWHQISEKLGVWKYSTYLADLQVAIKTENAEESMAILALMLEAVQQPIIDEDSLLYYKKMHTQGENGQQAKVTAEAFLPGLLKDLKENPLFDFLRDHETFKTLLRKYE